MSVVHPEGGPCLSFFTSSTTDEMNFPAIDSTTYNLSTDAQTWPQLANAPQTAPLTVRSKGASSQTIIGSLPPSSSTTGSSRLAATSAIFLPVRTEPVKKTLSTADSTSAPPV